MSPRNCTHTCLPDIAHTQTCLPRRHKGPVRIQGNLMNHNNRQHLQPCPLHNWCMWSHPIIQARTSRPGSWNTLTNQRWPHIYPLHMLRNNTRCRNRDTVGRFPPHSRCMLQCRLSFCICQLRITRMFPTLLLMLDHNSRPPPPSPQCTRAATPHAVASYTRSWRSRTRDACMSCSS